MLPDNAQERKDIPVYSGFICYFPDAIVEVAKLSQAGNDQHNPGSELHWDRSKSSDEMDSLCRHIIDGAQPALTIEEKIVHQRAVMWRASAQLQKLCEERAEDKDVVEQASREFWEKEVSVTSGNENSKSQKIAPAARSVHEYMRVLRERDDQ